MNNMETRLTQLRTQTIESPGGAEARSKRILAGILDLYHEAANAGDLVEVKNITSAARSTILPEWNAIYTGMIGEPEKKAGGAGARS